MYGTRLYMSILAVLLLVTGNIFYYQNEKLEGPFLLTHFQEVQLNEHGYGTLELYYVTNTDDKIWNVHLPGIQYAFVEHESIHQETTNFYVKRAFIELQDQNITEPLTITNIEIQFSQRDFKNFQVGEVIILPGIEFEREPIVQNIASSSSNSGVSVSLFYVKEPLTLIEITYPFEKIVSDYFQLSLELQADDFTKKTTGGIAMINNYKVIEEHLWSQSGSPLEKVKLPITLSENEVFKLTKTFDPSNSGVFIQIELKFMFENEDGNTVVGRDLVNLRPYFSNKELKELAKKAGGQHE